MPSHPSRSWRLRRSFKKSVSIYPRSTPDNVSPIITRGTFRQVPTRRFVYLLWNVPIQIFAICCIILEVYNGFRYRKEWHSTLGKKLGYILGFHLYKKITTWLEALLSLSVNWCKLALIFYGNSKL